MCDQARPLSVSDGEDVFVDQWSIAVYKTDQNGFDRRNLLH